MIEVTINGKTQTVDSELTLAELLERLSLNSRAIAVEINKQLKPRNTHWQTVVEPGDVLEIVTLVGGG